MSFSNPFKADRSMIRAAEPAKYPSTEMPEIKLMADVFFREKKYLRAMKNGSFTDRDPCRVVGRFYGFL